MLLILLLTVSLSSTLSLPDESRHLLSAKLSFSDPDGSLSSWSSDSEPDPCTNWYGVVCDPNTNSYVVSINLASANLAGPFPTSLCHLEHLSYLSLYNNSVNGTVPTEILPGCESLVHLDLAENLLTGELPGSLADLPELVYLDLSYNNFSGEIPVRFGGFRKLEVLSVIDNLFSGEVPAVLGNISSLKQLNLSFNPFSPGRIPDQIGNLTNLEILWMEDCNLVGPIPESLGRLERVTVLDLSINSLTGPIPSSLTNLKSVVQIELYNNSLTGELPRNGWANMPALKLFDASMNRLIGSIPDDLCSLPLKSLNLYENDLSGVIPKSLADSPNLFEIRLFRNRFTGELPRDLGKNSPLLWVDVSSNELTGELPPGLCDKGVLEELMVIHNRFSGEIPSGLGECKTLTRVRFGNNVLSGDVPEGLWGLPHVDLLELVNNSFTGKIEKMIGEAGNLSSLIISDNKFSGEIPEEIGRLGKLVEFSASGNSLTGSLPETMVNLGQLGRLDLHNNRLSGEISTEIHTWKKLNELNLANNEFSGNIPDEIGNLSGLNYLDLSGNGFSGKIPLGLQNLKLNQLNLSNNKLSGEIPPLYAKGIYKSSFMNNPGLCGDMAGLCDGRKGDKRTNNAWLLRSIFILAGLVFTIGVIWFYFKYQNFKRSKKTNDKSKWTLTSFHKLGFSEYEILDSLDEDNVIGSGSSGKVYKVVLSSGEAVAVKKLWGGSKTVEKGEDKDMEKGEVRDDGFEAEVETLGKIRHKNIVKLWCCCTTKDCKLLVYEYMPNGSLGDLLHSNKSSLLDWPMRFKIAMDSAEGLSYLHHDCAPPIVHRDVKSNNILLDGDFGARVADFGVAKSVDMIGKGSKSMSVIAGSCGYIAPEYAYTLRVNEKSDIYSFGVVILELVTGKRPIDPEFGEKDLVKWVCTTLDQKGIDNVIHPKLDICFKEEICKVLNIGLLCTSPLPINRPSMRRVVKMFQEIGGENYSKIVQKDGRLTPYYYEDTSDQGSVA